MLSSKAGKGNSLSISVSKSNEGVVDPNLISPVYSLDSFINWSIILVFFQYRQLPHQMQEDLRFLRVQLLFFLD